jgi:diacylglycerol kinase (ATP)
MINKSKRHIKDTMWSMSNAWKGVRTAYKSERNFRTELAIIGITIFLAILLEFNYIEFAIVLLASCAVLGAELLNTSIEETWNRLHPDHHEQVGKIKDLASGGVFMVGIGAAFAGLLVFVHHLF